MCVAQATGDRDVLVRTLTEVWSIACAGTNEVSCRSDAGVLCVRITPSAHLCPPRVPQDVRRLRAHLFASFVDALRRLAAEWTRPFDGAAGAATVLVLGLVAVFVAGTTHVAAEGPRAASEQPAAGAAAAAAAAGPAVDVSDSEDDEDAAMWSSAARRRSAVAPDASVVFRCEVLARAVRNCGCGVHHETCAIVCCVRVRDEKRPWVVDLQGRLLLTALTGSSACARCLLREPHDHVPVRACADQRSSPL